MAFSPDGKAVVTASLDNTARIWDALTGRSLHTLEGHQYPVWHAAFSPDGKAVVTASNDYTARIWDALTGRSLHTLKGHQGNVFHAVFSPDGKVAVTASWDNTARIWDVLSGRLLHSLEGHEDRVTHAVFSSDGKTVVTASNDNTARIWNALTGRLLQTLEGHENWIWHAAFSPDDKSVVTASFDNTARIWPVFHDLEHLIAHAERMLPHRRLSCEQREKKYFLDFVIRCAAITDVNIRGDSYQGKVQDESAHGQGQSRGRNHYAGGFRNGQKHGHGVYIWPDGERLEGEFKEDLFEAAPGMRLPVPKNADGWTGVAQESIDKPEAALAALEIQERLQSGHAELWRVRGDVLLQAKRPQEALAAYRKQFERFPDDARIHGKLGNAYLALQKTGKAVEAYRKQLEVEPRKLECAGREAFVLEQLGSSQCCGVAHYKLQGIYQGECNAEFQAHGQGRAEGDQVVYEGLFQNGQVHEGILSRG